MTTFLNMISLMSTKTLSETLRWHEYLWTHRSRSHDWTRTLSKPLPNGTCGTLPNTELSPMIAVSLPTQLLTDSFATVSVQLLTIMRNYLLHHCRRPMSCSSQRDKATNRSCDAHAIYLRFCCRAEMMIGDNQALDAEPPIASFLRSMLVGGGPVNAIVHRT